MAADVAVWAHDVPPGPGPQNRCTNVVGDGRRVEVLPQMSFWVVSCVRVGVLERDQLVTLRSPTELVSTTRIAVLQVILLEPQLLNPMRFYILYL